MKTISFILFFSVCIGLYAENKDDTYLLKKITEIETNFNSYKTEYDDEYFTTKVKTLENIIAYQDKVINGNSSFIIIISILISVLTIMIPILTYLLGIKPSQEKIKDLDQSLQNILKTTNDENINTAITNLSSSDFQVRQNAASMLSLNQHYIYSEYQVNRIVDIIRRKKVEYNIINSLENIISLKWSETAEEYFNNKLESVLLVTDVNPIIRFYINKGIKNYQNEVIKILKQDTKEKNLIFFSIIAITNYSQDELKQFLDNQIIVDTIENEIIKNTDTTLVNYFRTSGINDFYSSCYFHKKAIELNEEKKISEEKKKEKKEKKEKSLEDIITEYGLKVIEDDIFDKNGIKYPKLQYAPTLMGYCEIGIGVRVENAIIPLEEIQKKMS